LTVYKNCCTLLQKKVYDGLAEHGIVVDELGGGIQSIKISALKKKGMLITNYI